MTRSFLLEWPVYHVTCPECGKPLAEGADATAGACAACGWRERPDGAAPLLGIVAEPAPRRETPPPDVRQRPERRRRKKRRKPISEDYLTGRPPRHLPAFVPFLFVGLVACAWAALVGLTFVAPAGWYWLGGCGVVTFILGSVWVSWAAREDGIEMLSPWGGTGIVAVFLALVQLASIPVISAFHLASNFGAALPPALVLLMGIGMTVSAVFLMR